jgi:hypothetical protein
VRLQGKRQSGTNRTDRQGSTNRERLGARLREHSLDRGGAVTTSAVEGGVSLAAHPTDKRALDDPGEILRSRAQRLVSNRHDPLERLHRARHEIDFREAKVILRNVRALGGVADAAVICVEDREALGRGTVHDPGTSGQEGAGLLQREGQNLVDLALNKFLSGGGLYDHRGLLSSEISSELGPLPELSLPPRNPSSACL